MAWIELHESFREHEKIRALAKHYGISRNEAKGIIVSLWLWAVSNATDGDVTARDSEELAAACEVPQLTDMKDVLISIGWLDVRRRKTIIHDWKKHGIRMLEQSQ